jgi:hypothetical protein
VLVDAHPDSSSPHELIGIRHRLRRVASPDEREQRMRAWRRSGAIESYDWILPLMPLPIERVLWIRPTPDLSARGGKSASLHAPLPPSFMEATFDTLEGRIPPDIPVVVSIDLDSFAGLQAEARTRSFAVLWARAIRIPRITAITFAISRPWLADDAEASHLVLLALKASLSLAHAEIHFEPWGIEGPDRSERAKAFYREGRAPSRFDPETASAELRSLLLSNAGRLAVHLEPARWRDLLARWRAEGEEWRIEVDGVQPDADHIVRIASEASPTLRVEGGPPGRVRSVTWLSWTPKAWAYTVLPDLPAGKVFVGTAPPLIEYEASVVARTSSPSLGAEVWTAALPGLERSGVLRVSAEVETDQGIAHTARIEMRRPVGSGFRAGLSEQFGLPYVFGAGFLRSAGLRGPDTGVGNDCANFLVAAWRRSGLRMRWSNPGQLRRQLTLVTAAARAADRVGIPEDASSRGLVVHLGTHVAALWEDRPPLGTLGDEDLVAHHLGGAPEVITLAQFLRGRRPGTFDVLLGPSRQAAAWVAVGGDVAPGEQGRPPPWLRERLSSADLAVVNLETTAGCGGKPLHKRYVFRVPAARLLDLRELGVRAVSVANNHSGDFGPDGLRGTLDALDAEGLGHFGAGMDTRAAVSAWYGRARDVTVAFVGVSLTDPEDFQAGPHGAGLAVLPAHQREISEAIAEARARARVVVVVPHWGTEGSTVITDEQRRWAQWLVDQGADAVVGSGPHVVQGYETIEGVPVFYSLGNLWFRGRWPAASQLAGVAFLGIGANGRVVATRLERIGPLQ